MSKIREGYFLAHVQGFAHNQASDANARDYMDTALAPVDSSDLDLLEMFQVTEAARTAATKARARETAKWRRRRPIAMPLDRLAA